MSKTLLFFLIGLCLLLAPARPGRAEEAPPRFLIETIAVEGVRREAARGIVAAESHLRPGQSYSEPELADAVHRIKRLPFVLDAEFALRKGSERGAYELVVTVEETRPFFFSREVQALALPGGSGVALGYPSFDELAFHDEGAFGGRLFVGSRGMLFAAVRPSYSSLDGFEFQSFEVGYTQYELFGTRAAASLGYSNTLCCPTEVFPLGLDPSLVSWDTLGEDRLSFSLAVPLAGNHSLRLTGYRVEGEASERRSFTGDFGTLFFVGGPPLERSQAKLDWLYDSTDDPLFPTRGLALSGGLEVSTAATPLPGAELPFGDVAAAGETEATFRALVATGIKHWALTGRQSVALGLRAASGRSEIEDLLSPDGGVLPSFESDVVEYSLQARHSASLWGAERTRSLGDFRLESAVQYGWEALSRDPKIFDDSLTRLTLSSSLVFRNAWGVLRLGLSYVEVEGDPR